MKIQEKKKKRANVHAASTILLWCFAPAAFSIPTPLFAAANFAPTMLLRILYIVNVTKSGKRKKESSFVLNVRKKRRR